MPLKNGMLDIYFYGHLQYGDVPPPGVKAIPLRAPASAPAASPAAQVKGPAQALSPAEQEAAFRKRQLDEHKAEEKSQKEQKDQLARQENCTNAKAQLAQLESGQRIMQFDANGERHFIDDNERAAQIAKARQSANDWCK